MKLKLTRPICFFDLESTGTQITKDRIVQIGIIKIHPNGEEESYNKLVNPTIPIPLEIAEIHGITNDRVMNQPTFQELANEIISFIGEGDLAGYNSNKFDIPLLAEEFLRCNIEWLIIIKEKRIIYVKNIETTLFDFLISAKSLKINLFLRKNMTFTFGCCMILKNVYLKKVNHD